MLFYNVYAIMNLPIDKQRCNTHNRFACLLNLHSNLDIVCIRNILNFRHLLCARFSITQDNITIIGIHRLSGKSERYGPEYCSLGSRKGISVEAIG